MRIAVPSAQLSHSPVREVNRMALTVKKKKKHHEKKKKKKHMVKKKKKK